MDLDIMYLPRPSSKYKGCYPLHFEKHIPKLIKTENFIHLFSGSANLGFRCDCKFKSDLEDFKTPNMVLNTEKLPFRDNSFKGGFADPPYTDFFAKSLYNCEYPKFSLWTKELVRIVKIRGFIGIMQNYIIPKLVDCKYIKVLTILTRIKQYPKLVTIQQKIEHNLCIK